MALSDDLRTAYLGRQRAGVRPPDERAIRIDTVRDLISKDVRESTIINACCAAYDIKSASARAYLVGARASMAAELVRYDTEEGLRETLAVRLARIDSIAAEARRTGDLKTAASCQVPIYRCVEAAYRQKLAEREVVHEQVTPENLIAAAVECIRQNGRKIDAEQRRIVAEALGLRHLVAS